MPIDMSSTGIIPELLEVVVEERVDNISIVVDSFRIFADHLHDSKEEISNRNSCDS